MWHIEWRQYHGPWMIFKVTLLSKAFLTSIPQAIQHVLITICLQLNRKAHVACDFNCCIETEGLLKVTGSHVYTVHVVISRKRCEIEMLLVQTTNWK